MFRKLLFASVGLGHLRCPDPFPELPSARDARPVGHALSRKLMFAGVGLGVLGCLVLVAA